MPSRQPVLVGRISSLKESVFDLSRSIQSGDLKTAKSDRKLEVKGVLAELRLLGGALHSLQAFIHDLEEDDDDTAVPSARRQKVEWPILDGCEMLITALEPLFSLVQPKGLRAAKVTLAAYRTKFSFVLGSSESLEDISLHFSIIESEPLPLLSISKEMDQLLKKIESPTVQDPEGEDKPSAETVSAWLTVIQSATEDREPEEFLKEKTLVQSRRATTPQYQKAVQWPKYAEAYYDILRPQLCSLFRLGPPRSFNLVQWVLEYARETFPNIFGRLALSPAPLLELTDALCDGSVSPLHIAAALSLPSLCRDLLSMGADINQPSSLGTPIFCALAGPAVFKTGAHPESWTFLLESTATAGQAATVLLLLDKEADCDGGFTWKDANKASLAGLAFWVALVTDQHPVFSRVVAEGADIDGSFLQLIDRNAVLEYGQLHRKRFARLLTEVYDAALLVENHAFLIDDGNDNLDAFSDLKDSVRDRVREILADCQIEFICADDGGRIRTIGSDLVFKNFIQHAILGPDALLLWRLSLDPRFDPNTMSDEYSHNTLLHVATEGSHLEIMDILIKAGANLESVDSSGRTPAMSVEGTEALEKLVLQYGAKTTSTDLTGRTIWHFAAATNDEVLLKWLCQNDPCKLENMYKVDKSNRTPLDQAIKNVHTLINVPKRTKRPFPNIARMLVREYERLPPQSSPSIFETAVEWGELELLQGLLNMKSDSPLDLPRPLIHFINLGASETLVDRVLELSRGSAINDEHGRTAAETIFLNTKLQPMQDEPSERTNHPSCHHELSSQTYGKLLTPEVMKYRNSAGQGIWERFCNTVIPLIKGPEEDDHPTPGSELLTRPIIMAIRHLADRGAMADYERETGKSAFLCAGYAGDAEPTYWCWKQPLLLPILEASRNDATEAFLKSEDSKLLLTQLAIRRSCTELVAMLIQRGVCIDDEQGWAASQDTFLDLYDEKPLRSLVLKKIFARVHPATFFTKFGGMPKIVGNSPEFRTLIQVLIEKGLDVNWVPENLKKSLTLLVLAVTIDDCELMSVLLDNGADPHYGGPHGYSPLMAVTDFNRVSAAKLLLKHLNESGLKQIYTDKRGRSWNLLQRATSRGHQEILDFFLEDEELHAMINDTTRTNPNPPIHLAIKSGSINCVISLEASGADLTVLNADGMTIMQSARRRRDHSIAHHLKRLGVRDEPFQVPEDTDGTIPRSRCRRVGFLLSRAVDPDSYVSIGDALKNFSAQEIRNAIPPCDGCTILSLATRHSTPYQMHMLLKHSSIPLTASCEIHWPSGFNAICSAFCHIREESDTDLDEWPEVALEFEQYLEVCLDAYLDGELPWLNLSLTPVHAIFQSSNLAEVIDDFSSRNKCLHHILRHIQQNVDRYYWSVYRTTILDKELTGYRKFVVPLGLLSSPELADRTDQMDVMRRVEYCAVNARLENEEAIRDYNITRGATPLHMLVHNYGRPRFGFNIEFRTLGVLECLLNAGAEIDAQDDDLSTALHSAVKTGKDYFTRALLEKGANPNLPDKYGSTPLALALAKSNMDNFELLIRHGADPSMLKDTPSPILMTSKLNPEIITQLLRFGVDFYKPTEGVQSLASRLVTREESNISYVLNGDCDFYRIAESDPGVIQGLILRNCSARTLKMVLKRLPKECHDGLINSKTAYPRHGGCQAIMSRDMKLLQTLLDFGFDLERECFSGGTPLMFACRMGRLEAVKVLVGRGARVSYKTTAANGETITRSALDTAKLFPLIVRWLLVGRHRERRQIGWTETSTVEAIKPWSGPRVAAYQFSGQNSEFGRLQSETTMEFAKRLKGIRAKLLGRTLPVKLHLDKEPLYESR